MNIQYRSACIMLILGLAASVFVVDRLQRATQAQPPRQRNIEFRVDNMIRERGVVEAVRTIELRCEVKGGSTILSIVPEGSRVEKGDLLVELDDSSLREQLAMAKIENQREEAALVQGQLELQAVKLEGEAMLKVAENALGVAEVARESVLAEGGELAYELVAAEAERTIAEARLKTAKTLLSSPPGIHGPKTVQELELMIVEASVTIKVAEARTQFLKQHDRKHKTAQLDLEVANHKMQIVLHKNKLEKSRRIAQAELKAKEVNFVQSRQKADRIAQQLKRCKIHAPQAGLVVYATSGASRTGRTTAIAEGAQVRERQPIVQIPDMSKLRLKVRVNESQIARVRVGQSARIQVDAFPDKAFSGKVTHVNNAPEPSSWISADVKEYTVLVSMEDPVDSLRIGLTAMVEIDAGER